jgi:hypothetical protein
VNLKKNCFTINSYHQAVEIILISKKNKIIPILLIKYYLINGLGISWLNELKSMLENKFRPKDFKIFIEVKKNYGLFISLVEEKINYIAVRGNEETLKRLTQIAKLNKVVINPSFSVVDLSKSKNIRLKLKNIFKIN